MYPLLPSDIILHSKDMNCFFAYFGTTGALQPAFLRKLCNRSDFLDWPPRWQLSRHSLFRRLWDRRVALNMKRSIKVSPNVSYLRIIRIIRQGEHCWDGSKRSKQSKVNGTPLKHVNEKAETMVGRPKFETIAQTTPTHTYSANSDVFTSYRRQYSVTDATTKHKSLPTGQKCKNHDGTRWYIAILRISWNDGNKWFLLSSRKQVARPNMFYKTVKGRFFNNLQTRS